MRASYPQIYRPDVHLADLAVLRSAADLGGILAGSERGEGSNLFSFTGFAFSTPESAFSTFRSTL